MKIQIKNRFNDLVIFQADAESLGAGIFAAIEARANLSGADLSGADLSRASLFGADLSGASLSRANLSRASLSGADLSGANLSGANLSGANLSGANLSRANLSRASLSGANLSGASLSRANLSGADLSGADLSRANLSGADLSGAKNIDELLPLLLSQRTILPEGEIIVWKKLQGGVICKLKVPSKAQRVGGLLGRKCRCEYAVVLEGEGKSLHNSSFKYRIGKTVRPDKWDPNPLEECSHGIHFYITRAEAEAHR